MIRTLYQWLLWLHPPRFRREFAGEMLWIFESSVESEGPAGLFFDGLRSLARQWLLRSGSWKVGAALAGAALQVGAGSLGLLVFGQRQVDSFVETAPFRGDWVGNLRADAADTPIELALGKNPSEWFGALIMPASDGAPRSNSVLHFQARKGAVVFRVSTPEGELLFRGRLTGGKLAGTFEKIGEARAGAWELARPQAHAAGIAPSIQDLIGITVLLVPGVILAVVLLALWTRSFTHKRSHRFKPAIR